MDIFADMGGNQQHGLGVAHVIILTGTGGHIADRIQVGKRGRSHALVEGRLTGKIFRAHGLEDTAHKLCGSAVIKIGQGMGTVFLFHLLHIVGNFSQGFIPGNLGPLALAPSANPFKRRFYPVGIIHQLHTGITTGTDPGAVNRTLWITLYLDQLAVFDLADNGAAPETHLADRGDLFCAH